MDVEIKKPNLFNYAKKELSQDAMIAWLIEWANERFALINDDEGLHELGQRFVTALLETHGELPLTKRFNSTVHLQDHGIDVLARITDEHVLLIEDKTSTSAHSNQLKRYYGHVLNGDTEVGSVPKEYIYPINLKTGNQSLASEKHIEEIDGEFFRPYKVFHRKDFLRVLEKYEGNNSTVRDYRDYLNEWETITKAFGYWKEEERCKWNWSSWEGFFLQLEEKIRNSNIEPEKLPNWGYVPKSGFLGFWWNSINLPDDEDPDVNTDVYLQLEIYVSNPEKQKLCFKLSSRDKEKVKQWKWMCHEHVLNASNAKVVKPRVMRLGKTMTIGWWKEEWLAFNDRKQIDLERTVQNLEDAENILNEAATEICEN